MIVMKHDKDYYFDIDLPEGMFFLFTHMMGGKTYDLMYGSFPPTNSDFIKYSVSKDTPLFFYYQIQGFDNLGGVVRLD